MDQNDGLVLTASTADLQSFLLKHASTAGAFGDSSDLIAGGDRAGVGH